MIAQTTPTPRMRPTVTVSRATEADMPALAEGQLLAFGERLYGLIEPLSIRADTAIRYRRAAARLLALIDRPEVLVVKATVPAPGDAPTCSSVNAGMAFWHRPGAPVTNTQKRDIARMADETDEERDAWEGVDWKAWNGMLDKFDEVRQRIMGDEPHWYLGPLWTHPDYQGQGIGSALLRHAIALADATEPPTAMYLEASPAGQPVYARHGWERVEGTETVMIRRGAGTAAGGAES
ncbi:hypothetical protein JCM3770_000290 [Rhodotorula araucariae]